MGDVGDFLTRISPKAASPCVMHDGPRPDRPREVRELARRRISDCYVYMFLRDSWPIYIGMSTDPVDRFAAHTRKPWFLVANEYVLLRLTASDVWQARDLARAVEKQAIRMFGPSHNIAGMGVA